jgi:hypothetical protein
VFLKRNIPPHVSSLDFLLVSIRLIEHYFNMVEETFFINKMWVSKFICTVGGKFIECKNMECSCTKRTKEIINNFIQYVFDIKIADVVVEIEVLQGLNMNSSGSLLDEFNKSKCSFYEEGYKYFEREIINIILNKKMQCIEADYIIEKNNNIFFEGIAQSFMSNISFCDLIIACGQLSQILVFDIDNITRNNSTLMLRHINSNYKHPISVNKCKIKVSVKSSTILKMKNDYYRSANLFFDIRNCLKIFLRSYLSPKRLFPAGNFIK